MSKFWTVKLPVAGHIVVEIEALNEDDAIEKALNADLKTDMIEEWEALEQFNQGNVCYCPHPWEAQAEFSHEGED